MTAKKDKVYYPAQCSCGHLFMEKYQFAKPNKNGEVGFCWCGFCRRKLMVKPRRNDMSDKKKLVEVDGVEKSQTELAGDVDNFIGNTLSSESKGQLKFYIEQWKPRGE